MVGPEYDIFPLFSFGSFPQLTSLSEAISFGKNIIIVIVYHEYNYSVFLRNF